MEIIKGKYAEAKVFAKDLEQYARAQLQMICDNPVAEGSVIRVMSDVHPGKVGTIGLTMTIGERVIPNLLGVDIGCGMSCMQIKEKRLEYQKLDKVIRESIPSGFAVRRQPHHLSEEMKEKLKQLHCFKHINQEKAMASLGTLGGGNHFIEVDKDEDGYLYVIVHSGSRHLGTEITEYYIEEGAKDLKQKCIAVPYPLTWIEGERMEQYLEDVKIAQEYAALNREIILAEIRKGMKVKEEDFFSCIHNYVDDSSKIRMLRKGAISAKEGERVVIPVNMRDGVILGIGKGNPDWNDSAPHGSGRKLRRDEVKNHYTVSSFKNEMKGIHCTCVGVETLDEAPFAYRSMQQLMANLEETVTVTHILKPIYNYKAGGKV